MIPDINVMIRINVTNNKVFELTLIVREGMLDSDKRIGYLVIKY